MVLKRSKANITDAIDKKLEYIGLDLNSRQKELLQLKKLDFKILKIDNEKKYKQYRYINVNDIDILLTPTDR